MICKRCLATMVARNGRYGNFWACPNSRKGDNHGTMKYYPQPSKPSGGYIREIAFNDSPIQGIGNVKYGRDYDYEDDGGMGHLVGLDGWGGD